MKTAKSIVVLLLLCAAGAGNAWADRGHVHFGVMIGPYWGPWYYPPPYYYSPYYPPVVVERSAPQVYVEQQPAAMPPAPAAATQPAGYWYYCAAARGYYPYVKECPGGWQRVSPQPPGQP